MSFRAGLEWRIQQILIKDKAACVMTENNYNRIIEAEWEFKKRNKCKAA